MSEEELKIGMYTEDEIFQYMTEQEGGMFGRSMYDAIFDKIHTQITEIEQLKNENQELKEIIAKTITTLVNINGDLAYGKKSDKICNLIDTLRLVI